MGAKNLYSRELTQALRDDMMRFGACVCKISNDGSVSRVPLLDFYKFEKDNDNNIQDKSLDTGIPD